MGARDSSASALQQLLKRDLPAIVWRVSPDLERGLRRVYWKLAAKMRRGFGAWVVTSYHRLRGSVLTVDGVRLQVDYRLSRYMVEKIWSGAHTRPERTLVLQALTSDDVVLELGGGVGLLAISCALRIGGERVYTYEPNGLLAPLALRNCELNGVSPRFEFCALGRSEGTATLHVGRDFWGSSMIQASHHDGTLTVPVRAFDQEVARIRPTFLIVDIEGAEEELFRHATLDPFEKIMIELHPVELGVDRSQAVKKTIRDAGFVERRQLDERWYLYERVKPSPRSPVVPAG